MKTLKWFSLEYTPPVISALYKGANHYPISLHIDDEIPLAFKTEQQAFDWLKQNGYIERTKENEK